MVADDLVIGSDGLPRGTIEDRGSSTQLAIEEAIFGDNDFPSADGADYKMDVEDFIKVNQIDDVLVTALLNKPRTKMARLFQKLDLQVTVILYYCFAIFCCL